MKADLAASLIYDPDILFLDEPTIGIDVLSRERIREFIRQINMERHTTVILTTHDVSDIETLCEKMIIIDKGTLIYNGTLCDLKDSYHTTDLEEIIKQRLHKETSIGFSAELKDKIDKEKNILTKVTVEDIKKFGMIPEFVGRLPVICPMEILDKDMLVQILKEPKNAILKQYKKLLELDEVELEFSDDVRLLDGLYHFILGHVVEKLVEPFVFCCQLLDFLVFCCNGFRGQASGCR